MVHVSGYLDYTYTVTIIITEDHKLSWLPNVHYIKLRLGKNYFAPFVSSAGAVCGSVQNPISGPYAVGVAIWAWDGASRAELEPLAMSQRSTLKLISNNSWRY
ncbi:hypothetical protein J6590_082826 [Homalodisca vitripennis]|nr:hypothetical protein J6590_082826 [Homalodisca vitripennis]